MPSRLRGQTRSSTPAGRRRRGEGHTLRPEILAAARRLFLEDGIERVTIRAICAAVGVTAPALYRHFKNKREIVLALCNETFGALLTRFREIRAERGDKLAVLRRMMDAYVRFALEHPDAYRLLFLSRDLLREVADGQKGGEETGGAGSLGPLVLQELAEHVAACIDAGLLKPGDPLLVSESIWAAGHGLAALLITHPRFERRPRDPLIQATIEMVLTGVLAGRTSPVS